MSHITDLLDHANRDTTVSVHAMRYTQAPRPWRCLYCTALCDPRAWRGCCSPLCARLEHDTEPPEQED